MNRQVAMPTRKRGSVHGEHYYSPRTKTRHYRSVSLNVSVQLLRRQTQAINETWKESTAHQFTVLADTWRRQKGGLSSVSKKVALPAYLQIIGLGPAVIPFLLQELQSRPDHWFVALEAITKTNPVNESERTDFNQTVAAWLRWGRERGYI